MFKRWQKPADVFKVQNHKVIKGEVCAMKKRAKVENRREK